MKKHHDAKASAHEEVPEVPPETSAMFIWIKYGFGI